MKLIDNKLKTFAQILLKDYFKEFEALVVNFDIVDKKSFFRSHKKMLEKVGFDIEDIDNINDVWLFRAYAREVKRMYLVDWSGEEYSGQITRSIMSMLKNFDPNVRFKWNQKSFNSRYMHEMKRGEYIPLLLSEMDKVLAKMGYQIAFFENYSDTYSYCLLPTADMQKSINLSGEGFTIIDTKVYALYLQKSNQKNAKILIYLKNKFSLSLSEVKDFSLQPRILLSKGNLLSVTEETVKLKEIGAKWSIEELS